MEGEAAHPGLSRAKFTPNFIQYTDTQLQGDKFPPDMLTARQCEKVNSLIQYLKVSPRLNKHLISVVELEKPVTVLKKKRKKQKQTKKKEGDCASEKTGETDSQHHVIQEKGEVPLQHQG